jgi:hypothetical protein
MDSFSKRNNYSSPEKAITIREDAPKELREYLVQTLYILGYIPSTLRKIFCQVLRKAPDDNSWTEFPNVDYEVRQLVDNCEWYKVYDIIEAVYSKLDKRDAFSTEINDYFKENGIGWKLENGLILFRGDEAFESEIHNSAVVMAESNLQTARNEISESIKDLSRKPKPDLTGAIQHGLASLECVAREVTGNKTATLGAVISKNREIVPPPLDKAIESIWQFSSEQGRHLREGREPGFEEAELLVGLSASIGTYLARKATKLNKKETDDDELPF